MRKILCAALLAPVVASLGAVAVPAASASVHIRPATVRHLGSCRSSGDFATCVTSGSVNHPSSIHVHVSATPAQNVSGAWSIVCTRGSGAGSKSGSFHGFTTLTRNVPFPMRHPDKCTVSADAQLSRGGGIRVWLTARN
jgi:hypothetical protein